MKRFVLPPVAALLALLALDSLASAQFSYPLQGGQRYPGWQTPLSPYLNMLRPGDPAINYFALVQPEFQRRQDRGALYSSVQSLANQLPPRPGIAEEEFNAPLRSTGHPSAFGYTGGYFGSGLFTTPRAALNPFRPRLYSYGSRQSQIPQSRIPPPPPGPTLRGGR